MCVMISVMTLGFLLFHLHLIKVGATTNEKMKRGAIHATTKENVTFYQKWQQTLEKGEKQDVTESECEDYEVTGNEDLDEITKKLHREVDDLRRIEEPCIYKKATLW